MVLFSYLNLKTGYTSHSNAMESKIPVVSHPLFGHGPIRLMNRAEAASKSSNMMKSPFSTAVIMREKIFLKDEKRFPSSAIDGRFPRYV